MEDGKWFCFFVWSRKSLRWRAGHVFHCCSMTKKVPLVLLYRIPMCKILTSQIQKEISYSLIYHKLFTEEQKGCHKGAWESGDLLFIEQHIRIENKVRQKKKNGTMVWINYNKAEDIVQWSWIVDCLKMYKISVKIIKFVMEARKNENWI